MFTLYVDTTRWRGHLKAFHDETPGLVPVAKGNGYGFGNVLLAQEAARLGSRTLAVGTLQEAAALGDHLDRFLEVIVLTPYQRGEDPTQSAGLPDHVVRTVASVDALRELSGRRVVVECMTSLRRHGITQGEARSLRNALNGVHLAGIALHLPLDRRLGSRPLREVSSWIQRLESVGVRPDRVFVSHLSATEIAQLESRHVDVTFRPRVGTRLWLGDRQAFHARGTVLDVVPLRPRQRYGYRQRLTLRASQLVVVAGGTAHGVGLDAPKWQRGMKSRVKTLATAGMAIANRNRSPFRWQTKPLWFAEPPHMLVSLLSLPATVEAPVVGEELDAGVRMTTSTFDRIVYL